MPSKQFSGSCGKSLLYQQPIVLLLWSLAAFDSCMALFISHLEVLLHLSNDTDSAHQPIRTGWSQLAIMHWDRKDLTFCSHQITTSMGSYGGGDLGYPPQSYSPPPQEFSQPNYSRMFCACANYFRMAISTSRMAQNQSQSIYFSKSGGVLKHSLRVNAKLWSFPSQTQNPV